MVIKNRALGIMDRVLILSILPQKGNIVTMRIVSEFQAEVGFSDKEIRDWKIKQTETGVVWDGSKSSAKEFKIGESIISVLKEQIKELDEKGEIVPQHLELIKKLDL